MDKLTAADVMSPEPTALTGRHHLKRAAEELELGGIRHLPIVDAENIVVGVLSHRDIVAAGDDLTRPISAVMKTDVKTVSIDTAAHEAAYLVLHHRIGCVPVTDAGGRLAGIITDSDFVRVAYRALGGMVPVDEIESEEHESENV